MGREDLDPRVSDYFARRDTVAGWWRPDEGALAFHYDAEVLVLDDHLAYDPAWRVLDVGTGRGRFGLHFAARGCDVEAVDLNPDMVEIASASAAERGLAERYRVRRGSAEALPWDDAVFDVVLCMELFDHLPALAGALTEMRRVLRPGGRFLFTYVPSESLYGALGNAYRALHRRFRAGETMISRTYRHGALRRTLAAHGLALERYWGIGVACANAQTRLFTGSALERVLLAVARAEARRWPYVERPWLARRGAHVVGLARAADPAP